MRVIAGEARGRRLEALPGTDITRPTLDQVKEAMFSIVQFDLPGARVLDPVSYTHLDVYKRQMMHWPRSSRLSPPSSGCASCDAAIKFPEAAALPRRRPFRKRMRLNPVIDHSRDLR